VYTSNHVEQIIIGISAPYVLVSSECLDEIIEQCRRKVLVITRRHRVSCGGQLDGMKREPKTILPNMYRLMKTC